MSVRDVQGDVGGVSNFYATKRDLWQEVQSHLTVWPSLKRDDGFPALRFCNDVTGYVVDLDYFREDILARWLKRHGTFPMDAVAVGRYLTQAKSFLPHDISQVCLEWGSRFLRDALRLEMAVRGKCTLTFSETMVWFMDLANSAYGGGVNNDGIKTIHVGGSYDTLYYIRWKYDTYRYRAKSPCNVILMYQKDVYLLEGWYRT